MKLTSVPPGTLFVHRLRTPYRIVNHCVQLDPEARVPAKINRARPNALVYGKGTCHDLGTLAVEVNWVDHVPTGQHVLFTSFDATLSYGDFVDRWDMGAANRTLGQRFRVVANPTPTGVTALRSTAPDDPEWISWQPVTVVGPSDPANPWWTDKSPHGLACETTEGTVNIAPRFLIPDNGVVL